MFHNQKVFLAFFLFMAFISAFAQPSKKYYFNLNVTETSLRNPKIGIEIFSSKKKRRSFVIEFSFKIQDKQNSQFLLSSLNAKPTTLPPARGFPKDVVSLFVYNGPTFKLAKTKYSNKRIRNNYLYRSVGALLKYNWYENQKVKFDDQRWGNRQQIVYHYRKQSERMFSLGASFEWGILKKSRSIAYNFYFGALFNFRHRDKMIDFELYEYRSENGGGGITYFDYSLRKENNQTFDFYPTFGIRFGWLR